MTWGKIRSEALWLRDLLLSPSYARALRHETDVKPTMEVSTPRLPMEIIGQIVNDLDAGTDDGRSSLLACSSVSGALARLAQERIFRDVTITMDVASRYPTTFFEEVDNSEGNSPTGKNLLALLKKSPHIAPYIRSIEVKAVGHGVELDPHPRSFTSDSPDFPLYVITALASNLQRLVFDYRIWFNKRGNNTNTHMRWSSLQPRMQEFLVDLIKRIPAIGLLPFEAVPMSIFHRSAVKELHISSMHQDTKDVPPSKIRLGSLELYDRSSDHAPGQWSIWFNSPNSAFNITNLQTLKTHRRSSERLSDILSLCSNSLQTLDLIGIDIRPYNFKNNTKLGDLDTIGYIEVAVDLGALSALSELTIKASLNPLDESSGYDFETNLLHVLRILKTLPCHTSPTLRVTLDMGFGYVEHETGLDYLSSIPWPVLIFSMLDEDEMRARWKSLKIQFPEFTVPDGPVVPRPRDILDVHEEFKDLRLKGLLSY